MTEEELAEIKRHIEVAERVAIGLRKEGNNYAAGAMQNLIDAIKKLLPS